MIWVLKKCVYIYMFVHKFITAQICHCMKPHRFNRKKLYKEGSYISHRHSILLEILYLRTRMKTKHFITVIIKQNVEYQTRVYDYYYCCYNKTSLQGKFPGKTISTIEKCCTQFFFFYSLNIRDDSIGSDEIGRVPRLLLYGSGGFSNLILCNS